MRFSLSSPATGTHPFAIGFAFRQGDVPSGRSVVASLADVQVSVLARWPDGSARWGVVAGRAALAAGSVTTVTLSAADAAPAGTALSTADLRATGVSASIGCGRYGSAAWSGADWDQPVRTWVNGPEMSSWLYRKPVGSDAHLVAWLEVRLFADGAVDVLPWVENGYLLEPGPSNRLETYSFLLGGSMRFSGVFDLLNHCRSPLLSGSGLSHWLAADPRVTVAHDSAYLMATEMVPTYLAQVSTTAAAVTALPATFAPLQLGSLPPSMGAVGYDPSIGLLPEWDVLYLTSLAPAAWSAVQYNGYSAGRYGLVHRDKVTQRPLKFSDHPNLALNSVHNSGISERGTSATGTYTPAGSGPTPPTWASSHHPSVGFMAALISGRCFHVETVQFAAGANYLRLSSDKRQTSDGLIRAGQFQQPVRNTAWSLRTLVQALAITPDDDPLQADYRRSWAANVDWYHARYVAQPHNVFGFIEPYADLTSTITRTGLAGSTTTVIQLGDASTGSSETAGAYIGHSVTIGTETRTVVAYTGKPLFQLTVDAPFNVSASGASFTLRDNQFVDRGFYQDFFTAVIGYGKALDLLTDSAKLDAFFGWKAASIIGRFGGTAASDYLWRDAAAYNLSLAPTDAPDWATGAGPWHADWGDVWDQKQVLEPTGAKEAGDGSLRVFAYSPTEATGYWGNLQPALAYSVRFSLPGASDAYRRMTSASNWPQLLADFNRAPVWSVRPAAA